MRIILMLSVSVLFSLSMSVQGQLKKQILNSDTPADMTPQELAELGDPIFELLLKNNSDKTALDDIEALIQPNATNRQLFVVDETIVSGTRPQNRRAVIAFRGMNGGVNLSDNAMLSVMFNDTTFRDDAFVEAWGWDEQRNRYNYYRMDGGTWKFRGSSKDTALFGKGGSCFACHLNGAPIMKELLRPWNHWHSMDFEPEYLDRLQPNTVKWPIVDTPRFSRLVGARFLDLAVRASVANFNTKRIDEAIDNDKLANARTILRSLFETTEFNIISSAQESNMHPLAEVVSGKPDLPVKVPESFFLNSAIVEGDGASGFAGLGVRKFQEFQNDFDVTPDEYKALVEQFGLKIGNQPGDAHFAWLSPEASDIDNNMIQRLIDKRVVPGQYVAAVMAIDLETAVFSEDRKGLLQFIPDSYELSDLPSGADFKDVDWFKAHDLTLKTILELEAADLTANPSAAEFLAILKMTNGTPMEVLTKKVEQYAEQLKTNLNGPDRKTHLEDLFKKLLERRKFIGQHPLFHRLDETGGSLLFPSSN